MNKIKKTTKRIKNFNINDFIYTKLRNSKSNHSFWYFVAEILTDKKKRKEISRSISYHIYTHNTSGLQSMMVGYDLFVINNRIYLITQRPGIWIGKGGAYIDELTKTINYNVDGKKIYDYHIDLVEDKVSQMSDIYNNLYFQSNNY